MEKKNPLHRIFFDRCSFDGVPRELIPWALRQQRVPENLLPLIMCLYTESKARINRSQGCGDYFKIKVGLHQGSALRPLLFIIVIEEVIINCLSLVPWDMLYADDLVISAEMESQSSEKFNTWNGALQKRGLKINVDKTKNLISGQKSITQKTGKYPCACCLKGVGGISLRCNFCNQWVHKKRSSLRKIPKHNINYVCASCKKSFQLSLESECYSTD